MKSDGQGDVGIFLAEKCTKDLKTKIDWQADIHLCCFVPTQGLLEQSFYDDLHSAIMDVPTSKGLFLHGACNGHVGSYS